MNVLVRRATCDDLEVVYILICDLEDQQMDGESFSDIFIKNLSDPNIYYFVAELNKRIVGFLSLHVQHILHHSKPTCELQELTIVSELRGSGIGRMLIEEAEKTARILNLEEIELTTKTRRIKAQNFYRKLGFEHTHNKFVKRL
jgi:(aminoalkyl)phosphonate N-acetyltransferase